MARVEGLLRRYAPCPSGRRRLRLQRSKHFVLCRTPSEVLIIFFDTTKKGFRFKGSLSNNGARGRIRTSDRLVRSQVLYPAELHAHLVVGRYYATRR